MITVVVIVVVRGEVVNVRSCFVNRLQFLEQIRTSARSHLSTKLFDGRQKTHLTAHHKSGEGGHLHPRRVPRSVIHRMSQESGKSWFPCRSTRKSTDAKSRERGTSTTDITAATVQVDVDTNTPTTSPNPSPAAPIATAAAATITTGSTIPDSMTGQLKAETIGTKWTEHVYSWSAESEWPECRIPQPVFALFVYLAQRGVHVNDLFRRPGNITQMKHNPSLRAQCRQRTLRISAITYKVMPRLETFQPD
ncbi:unnamed protein product [Echinostoma caproni]|uniref:Rho-GAP domain-containing protein n=1 Tax=Echinostoma caproni TaxID=27848 RepID=A0A183ASU7_9TREM|nr:unnamed protein product [Echinostoma caproni]